MKNIIFICLSTWISLLACNSQKKTTRISFVTPLNNEKISAGDTITLQLNIPENKKTDSIVYFLNNEPIEKSLDNSPLYFDSSKLTFGNQQFSAKHFENGQAEESGVTVMVVPEASPQQYSFSVINKFPHDKTAYTQGLEYHNGFLYESTGEYGSSSLRKVDLKTGSVLKKIDLPDKLFGEGLTIVGDKLIQLTWKEGIGIVYNKESFEKVKEFSYQASKEGWGLCYDGEKLIKSDGTNRLYFLDPETYAETGRFIDVYDNNGPVDSINELEYIDGKIFANVYLTDKIIIIDPSTGKIDGELNLIGLLPEKDRDYDTDVLNGIAYDNESKRLFVTGKKWNSLFEIKILDR